MKAEDILFLMQAINALRSEGYERKKFLSSKDCVSRLIHIVNKYGNEAFNKKLIELKEVIV